MDLPTNADVLDGIRAFLKRHDDMAPTTFGSLSTGDPNLVSALEKGASPRLERLHRIRDFMAARDREAGFDHVVNDASEGAGASPGKAGQITAQAHV